ncbi:AAA family ATPase [Rothia sp. ZJ932]|nr:AAA family ATPase [Rothia sp. ZJ932]
MQCSKSVIDKIQSSVRRDEEELTECSSSLESRKRSLLSSEAVAAKINNLLLMCNFHSFKIKVSETDSGGYFIIRNNGDKADIETLSEGERNFITFLYFLQILDDEGTKDTKSFVVIDDPISSLDSDVMFTVSMLIRDLIEKVYKGTHENVAQILIMTHNTRFHNEVCYRYNGRYPQEYHFYRIIKKSPEPNSVEFYGQVNSIRTSYQELWDQVAIASREEFANHPWLANTMRRIIESFFSTLGGELNLYEIDSNMSYEEKIVHNSLIAWSHSGSHTIMDNDSINLQSHNNEKWLRAFRIIFEKTGNISHYEVMMRNANQFIANII